MRITCPMAVWAITAIRRQVVYRSSLRKTAPHGMGVDIVQVSFGDLYIQQAYCKSSTFFNFEFLMFLRCLHVNMYIQQAMPSAVLPVHLISY